ncbi:MAG: hypothetical protein JO035_02715 [Betaproteobacteria bacterium]|nr:hypothetical protein [Betaproteobacteria bacterium]
MKIKVLGAAVATALLGLSTLSFGQSAGGSAPSSQDTPREAARAQSGAGSQAGTTGTVVAPAAPAVVDTSRCDNLTGAAKTRCMRDASSGASAPGVPVTQEPGQSGPGAVDKTRPGQEPTGRNRVNPRDAGTSSSGG